MQQERRREVRVMVEMPVTVTVLAAAQEFIPARVADLSGNGLLLITPNPIPVDAAVCIEGNDLLLLGEVCRCEASGEESRVAVQVRHSLNGLMALERLNRALLGCDARAAKPARVEK